MKRRNFSMPDQEIVSTEHGLAATKSISSRRPVGGEMFFLTAPFREHWATWRVISGRFIDSTLHMSPCRDVLRRALPLMLMTATSSSSLKPVYEQEEQARNNNGEEQGQ